MAPPRDPDHPVIEKPWECVVVLFSYVHDPSDPERSYIDLHLRRGDRVHRLRFGAPLDLSIEKGFPRPTWGLQVLDVRSRQLEGVGVEVSDFEGGDGRLCFLARDVVDLDVVGD